jgi:hypothetical protein
MKEKEFNAEFGFTGVYCRDYQEYRKGSGLHGAAAVKEEKKRPQFKGYKTRIKREGSGTGLYVERRYFTDKARTECQKAIDGYEDRKEQALTKYQKELERLAVEQEGFIAKLAELENRN